MGTNHLPYSRAWHAACAVPSSGDNVWTGASWLKPWLLESVSIVQDNPASSFSLPRMGSQNSQVKPRNSKNEPY